MKMTIYRSSWLVMLIAGALVAPARLSAQRTDPARNHIVKPGDTLWNLSAAYLGDGNRWREFLTANPSLRNRSMLAVGTTLRIPGAAKAAKPSSSTASAPPTETVKLQRVAQQRPYRTDTVKRTIFFGASYVGGFTPLDSNRYSNTDPGVPANVFEGISAPFVADDELLDAGGRCVSVGPTNAPEARGVLLHGTMEVQLPAGSAMDTSARWLLVRRGPLLTGLGIVAIPTGVVRLTSRDGAAFTEVVAQYDKMSCDDVLLPAIAPPASKTDSLTPVPNGPWGSVVWVASGSQLPTLQHVLILDMGSEFGVRLGDRITIFGSNGSAVVASADIVRVDQRTATALVVRQSLGSLTAGLRVRVTEKLP
jgi:LysM repeat protein